MSRRTGVEAIWYGREHDYDAIVLDVMIPPPDGFEVVRQLRGSDCWAPVLLLTARDQVTDRVTGLDAGADDYLTKPFALRELAARVRALTRRALPARPSVLRVDDLTLDQATHRVQRGDQEISLVAQGVRAAARADATPGTAAHPHASDRACLGLRVRCGIQRCRRLHRLSARQARPSVRPALHRDRSGSRLSHRRRRTAPVSDGHGPGSRR